jgi:hypothetical protein
MGGWRDANSIRSLVAKQTLFKATGKKAPQSADLQSNCDYIEIDDAAPKPGLRRGSVVVCRQQFQGVRLRLIMVDEKFGVISCNHPFNLIHGGN